MMFVMMTLMFLQITELDIKRRKKSVIHLATMLEPDLRIRNPDAVNLPAINFMDPRSLVAYLDMRELLIKVGSRFAMRI